MPWLQPTHAQRSGRRQQRQKLYDHITRDPELKTFYGSAAWQKLRAAYKAANPICEQCQTRLTEDIHHKVKLAANLSLGLDWNNLKSMCRECHAIAERQKPQQGP